MDATTARVAWLSSFLSMVVCFSVSAQTEVEESLKGGPNWEAITGTWLLETASRDGKNVDGMQGTRYFLEPGLMRWANPELKSETTGMAIMMGRRLNHVDGNKYRSEAIYPIAEPGDVQIDVDGESMKMIVTAGVGQPQLVLTLLRKHGRSPKPPRDRMLGLAKGALKEGKLAAANQFAQLQLINYPDDRDGAIILVDTQLAGAMLNTKALDSSSMKRTRAQATWVLEKFPDAYVIRRKFGALLNRVGLYVDASAQFEALEEAGQFDEESMRLHAQSLAQMGRREQGRRKLEEMIGYDSEAKSFTGQEKIKAPNSAFLLLASALAAEGKQEEAVKVIDHFVETYPDLPRAHLDRGRFYARQDLEKASLNLDKALELGPEDLQAMLVNIEFRLRNPSPEIDELIERTFAIHGRQPVLIYLAATRAGMKREFDQALAMCDEGLAMSPNERSLLLLKVQLLVEKQDRAAAQALIRELPKRGIGVPMAQLLQAEMLMAFQEYSQATNVLSRINTARMPTIFVNRVQQAKEKLAAAMEAAASTPIADSLESKSPQVEQPPAAAETAEPAVDTPGTDPDGNPDELP